MEVDQERRGGEGRGERQRSCNARVSMIMASSQRFKADVRIFSILCASTKVLVLGLVFLVPMGFQYS